MASGAGAVEYIICHAEVSIAFAEETKISEVIAITLHYDTLFSFLSTSLVYISPIFLHILVYFFVRLKFAPSGTDCLLLVHFRCSKLFLTLESS